MDQSTHIEEMNMAKAKELTVEDVITSVDGMSFEDLAKVKEAVKDKMESAKHLVITQFRQDLQAKMDLFGISQADLGFGTTTKGNKKASGEAKQRQMKGGPCKVCAFETAPPHDARAHRSQGDNKKPFTKDELQELGLEKV